MHDELLTNKIALHLSNGAYHRTVYMTVACKVQITSVSHLHGLHPKEKNLLTFCKND